jgi:SAM-dependent methyltransferase
MGVSPRWEAAATVAGFRTSPPNLVLLEYARQQRAAASGPVWALDIGGGAGRNAVPVARLGFHVVCTDLSLPMLAAARQKREEEAPGAAVHLAQAPMTPLPFPDQLFDLIIAHGIWNLARSGAEFRSALREAARVARPGAGLFLFTFSRHTIPADEAPVPGETFVFTQFNGEPQCFLTEAEILEELGAVGFVRDPAAGPLREYNRGPAPRTAAHGPPILYEGTFTYRP